MLPIMLKQGMDSVKYEMMFIFPQSNCKSSMNEKNQTNFYWNFTVYQALC